MLYVLSTGGPGDEGGYLVGTLLVKGGSTVFFGGGGWETNREKPPISKYVLDFDGLRVADALKIVFLNKSCFVCVYHGAMCPFWPNIGT